MGKKKRHNQPESQHEPEHELEASEAAAWEEEEIGTKPSAEEEVPKDVIDANLEVEKIIVWKDWEKVYEP